MEKDLANKIEELGEYGFAFAPARIIATAVQLDLLSLLEEAKTSEELSRIKGISHMGLTRLLDALVTLGILNKREDRYLLEEPMTQLFLPSSPLSMGRYFLHLENLHHIWGHLSQVVTSGKQVERKPDPEFPVTLARGLFPLHWFQALDLGEKIEIPDRGKVLDVAGGSGVWSAGILKHHPHLQGVLLDLPAVLEEAAKPILKKIDLLNRYRFLPGDMFEINWGKGYTCIILGHICHALGEDDIRNLIEKSRQAVGPQGILIIIDFLPHSQNTFPAIFNLNMLLATKEGGVHKQEEYSQWLRDGGFTIQEILPPWDKKGSKTFIATLR